MLPVSGSIALVLVETLGEIKRGDDLFLLQPLVDTESIAAVTALEHEEFLVELLLRFLEDSFLLEKVINARTGENTSSSSRCRGCTTSPVCERCCMDRGGL